MKLPVSHDDKSSAAIVAKPEPNSVTPTSNWVRIATNTVAGNIVRTCWKARATNGANAGRSLGKYPRKASCCRIANSLLSWDVRGVSETHIKESSTASRKPPSFRGCFDLGRLFQRARIVKGEMSAREDERAMAGVLSGGEIMNVEHLLNLQGVHWRTLCRAKIAEPG